MQEISKERYGRRNTLSLKEILWTDQMIIQNCSITSFGATSDKNLTLGLYNSFVKVAALNVYLPQKVRKQQYYQSGL